ncbi:MAG: ABC transporter substrate-binding protein [Syntrophobacteraceae bacterium]
MKNSFLPGSTGSRIALTAIAWLLVITMSHLYLHGERRTANLVRMGYMPVVANLASPLVDYVTKGDDLYFEALKFSSFSEIGEAFRSGHIQAAFIIAPLAIALFEQGVPLKIVYIGNRHESTLVMRLGVKCELPSDIAGKTIAVPIRYSGHFLALKRYLRQHCLDGSGVSIVEVPPPDMPAALASSQIDGYFVGEPFASKALAGGTAKRFLDVESVWPKFICNVLIVREELIREHPQWVEQLVATAARSGIWAESHVDEAIEIVSRYWGQDPADILYAFSHPPGRFRFDLYVPVAEELNEVFQEMRREGLTGTDIDTRAIVEDRFAKAVQQNSAGPPEDVFSIKRGPGTGTRAQVALP